MNPKAVIAILGTLVLSACNKTANVQNAQGETAVRYVVCGPNESNCFVSARFRTMAGCESHRKWADMLCDSLSKPGTMICSSPSPEKQSTFTYCTM